MIGCYLVVYFGKCVLLASKHMQCRLWHRLLQMNCLTAIYNAERFNNKCMKVALLIDLTDRPSRYVQSAFALHQLFIFNVAMQFIPLNKDVCLIYYIYGTRALVQPTYYNTFTSIKIQRLLFSSDTSLSGYE